MVSAIVFAEARQAGRTCQDIVIMIADQEQQQFVDKQDLLVQLTVNTPMPILGTPLQALKTQHIEDIVKKNNFIRKGVAYKTWQGVLKIAIIPRRPIARIIYPHQQSQYLDEDGTLLPLSDRYTARVLLVESAPLRGAKENLREHDDSASLLALLNYIDRDPFWRAQISYMHINEKGKVTMYMQIGKQCVEFGTPEAIKEKLTKLYLFYQQIAPYKGWNAYKRVNVEFDNQIVCE